MVEEITKAMIEAFQEVGNIGIGNAATALSTMIEKDVKISLPCVKILRKEEIFNDDSKKDYLIVNSIIEGGYTGNILVVYEKEKAFPLIKIMLCQEEEVTTINEDAKSAFKEMVNVIGGAYLDSISQMTNEKMMPKPPSFSYGNMVSIKDSILQSLPENAEEIIYVKTEMSIDGEIISGDFYLIFNPESMRDLIGTIA